MKVIVCGARDFGNLVQGRSDEKKKYEEYRHVLDVLDELSLGWPRTEEDEYGNWLPLVTIISGMARGVDTAAADWAVINGCYLIECHADWKTYGRKAGAIRNEIMLALKPDLVVAFPTKQSIGTRHMMRIARAAGVPVKEYPV